MRLEFEPFPVLETSRLILRRFRLADASDLFEMRSNPDMLDYSDGRVDEYLEDTIKYIKLINTGIDKKKWINWAIVNRLSNRVIGSINIWNFGEEEVDNKILKKAEIGYGLNPNYHNLGLMSEAIKVVIDYGFNAIFLDKIEIWTERRNLPSIKLVEKNGFKFLKEVREDGYYKKHHVFNMRVYELKREDI